jgi:hypothetical protein
LRKKPPRLLGQPDFDNGNYEVLKSRWVENCEADFAALPAATQTRFVLEHARLIRRHLLKKCRHSVLIGGFLGKFWEGENGLEHKVTLGGSFFLGGGDMKILAANAALIPADAKHPEQRKHHGRLAGAIGADEGGQLRAKTHRLRIRPEATEIGEGQALKLHEDLFPRKAARRLR